jgi:hypothetical protein
LAGLVPLEAAVRAVAGPVVVASAAVERVAVVGLAWAAGLEEASRVPASGF